EGLVEDPGTEIRSKLGEVGRAVGPSAPCLWWAAPAEAPTPTLDGVLLARRSAIQRSDPTRATAHGSPGSRPGLARPPDLGRRAQPCDRSGRRGWPVACADQPGTFDGTGRTTLTDDTCGARHPISHRRARCRGDSWPRRGRAGRPATGDRP